MTFLEDQIGVDIEKTEKFGSTGNDELVNVDPVRVENVPELVHHEADDNAYGNEEISDRMSTHGEQDMGESDVSTNNAVDEHQEVPSDAPPPLPPPRR